MPLMLNRSLQAAVMAGCTGLMLLATACSGGSADDSTDENSGGGQNNAADDNGKSADDALKLRKCLREQGIDMPDPEPGQDPRGLTLGGDADPKKFQEALKKCGSGTSGRKGGGSMTQADKDKMIKYAQCMRKNGVDMKDPKFDGGSAVGEAMRIPKGQEKKFEKANKLCSQTNG
ncbi:hypothetical protein [Streptomyces luteolus]|uniref:Lipoprotein n=1 Tax=Streptomyces luteolus TaxID=3043615 RepID=A0ABT6T121_9ACTN|nr:hypothetical protein [Streptomyces sp. B-S-A12]MDI3421551.1 hypothetical protein [Streptomyces sp. B-S-A12]